MVEWLGYRYVGVRVAISSVGWGCDCDGAKSRVKTRLKFLYPFDTSILAVANEESCDGGDEKYTHTDSNRYNCSLRQALLRPT